LGLVELLRPVDGVPVVIGRRIHSGVFSGVNGLGFVDRFGHRQTVPLGSLHMLETEHGRGRP
jgi:hypothetical protein